VPDRAPGTAGGESEALERGEVETLAAYVKALGGKLKIIADFGDESYVLGQRQRGAAATLTRSVLRRFNFHKSLVTDY